MLVGKGSDIRAQGSTVLAFDSAIQKRRIGSTDRPLSDPQLEKTKIEKQSQKEVQTH